MRGFEFACFPAVVEGCYTVASAEDLSEVTGVVDSHEVAHFGYLHVGQQELPCGGYADLQEVGDRCHTGVGLEEPSQVIDAEVGRIGDVFQADGYVVVRMDKLPCGLDPA